MSFLEPDQLCHDVLQHSSSTSWTSPGLLSPRVSHLPLPGSRNPALSEKGPGYPAPTWDLSLQAGKPLSGHGGGPTRRFSWHLCAGHGGENSPRSFHLYLYMVPWSKGGSEKSASRICHMFASAEDSLTSFAHCCGEIIPLGVSLSACTWYVCWGRSGSMIGVLVPGTLFSLLALGWLPHASRRESPWGSPPSVLCRRVPRNPLLGDSPMLQYTVSLLADKHPSSGWDTQGPFLPRSGPCGWGIFCLGNCGLP